MTIAPVGLLMIRAWVEEGCEQRLRVVIRLTGDSWRGFEHELALSDPARVEEVVREWLANVAGQP
jgi:hypothetical protein